MYIDLIYQQKKVFSSRLMVADTVESVLCRIKEKEDLGTAILVLEDGEHLFLLFVLENKLYAVYRLVDDYMSALLFSDYFKETASIEAQLDLYQVSPVLFKCLLILAQMEPTLNGTNEVIDAKHLLRHIKEKKKEEAVLALKEEKDLSLFYFIEGGLRDAYTEEDEMGYSEKKRLLHAFSGDAPVQITLFDQCAIEAALDAESAEKMITIASAENEAALQKNKERDGEEEGFCVEVLSGSRVGFLIRSSSEPVSLGRGDVDVRLSDPQVSRFHAELEWLKTGLVIRDHSSTNGLFVNDERITKKTLISDDVIRMGDVSLKVVPAS